MGLRKRTILVIATACLLLTAVVYTTVREIVLREYTQLENQAMMQNLDRGLMAYRDEGRQLLSLTQDWAFWDDTYQFISNPHQKYIQSNLPMITFEEQALDLVAYFNLDGDMIWGRMYDHVRGRPLIFPESLLRNLRLGGPVLGQAGARGMHGCLPLDKGIIMLAVAPILASGQEGPSRGWLVMGRKLVLEHIRALGKTTVLSLDAIRCPSPSLPENLCREVQREGRLVRRKGNTLQGFVVIDCLDGSNDYLLRVEQPRTIYGYALGFLKLHLWTMVVSMAVLGVVILMFVNRSVLGRIISIRDQVRGIGTSGDPFKRVRMQGGAELEALAREINGMLDQLNDNESFMHRVLDALEAGVALADPQTGQIRNINIAASRIAGQQPEQIVGRYLSDFGLPSPAAHEKEQEQKPEMLLGTFLRDDGREVPVLITSNRVNSAGRTFEITSFIDVSELEKTQKALRQSEDKYRIIFNNTGTASILIAPDTTIVLANREFESLCGLRREEVEGLMSWRNFFLNEDVRRMEEYHTLRRSSPEAAPRNYETRFVTSSGEVRSVQMTVAMLPDGRQSIASIMDITQRKKAEERLAHQAYHDELTGLPNRSLLLERLQAALDTASREGGKVALLMLDLDRFKNVNDSFGHHFGDRLLKQVGQRIEKEVCERHTVARLGGDEYLVLVEDVENEAQVEGLARKLLDGFRLPVMLEGRELYMALSIGVTMYPTDGGTPDELMSNVDLAMYRAKRMGRNTYCMYTGDLNAEVRRKLTVENELRAALLAEEIEVHFQPVVETGTGRFMGAEALARWRAPDGSLRPPSEFIPVAEETGLISTLDMQVLMKACHEAVSWSEFGFGETMVSVNISAAHFLRRDIRKEVRTILETTGIAPNRLCLELTETAVMRNKEAASRVLREVAELGVWVALDDFGTGYSSLSYLQLMPIKTLKIDRSFVSAIRRDKEDTIALVNTIISLSSNLRLRTVAEGVETREQYEVLREGGCSLCQGFYFSKPLPPEELRLLFSEQGGIIMPEE